MIRLESSGKSIEKRLEIALSHPLRARALAILDERVASPKELALELGAPLGVIAYHVRVLGSLELIELVDQTQRRGAVEHRYTAVPRPTGENS